MTTPNSSATATATRVWGCPQPPNSSSSSSSSSSPPPRPIHSAPSITANSKVLQLSLRMGNPYIVLQIQYALRNYAYNCLECHALVFSADDDRRSSTTNTTTSTTAMITRPLQVLLHSRTWRRMEFQDCEGIEALLVRPTALRRPRVPPPPQQQQQQ